MAEGKYGAKYGTQYGTQCGTQCGTIGLRFYRTEAWIKHEIQDRDVRIKTQDLKSQDFLLDLPLRDSEDF